MKKTIHFLLLLMIFFVVTACSNEMKDQTPEEVELIISAAASLQDAFVPIQKEFEEKYPTIKLVFNFGGSGALQQQISQGAPADLFFSAATDKFDTLINEGLINEEDGVQLLGNEIVLVIPKDHKNGVTSFDDLSNASKISIGTPESVPAGQYGKEALENMEIWNEIEDKIVYAKDVRQVLTYVETNNIDAGIVYKTDAVSSNKVEIVASADADSHPPIIYPVGVIKDSKHRNEALKFYEFLQTKNTIKTFEEFGFKGLIEAK
ncbi:molybdate ABC transporter substrate-binding protein [Bacillus sp. REN16]|uniref:molybdate ABC transporter substrate-binding protein n=1 Tax=Bacillus sp. REN16 TaxID=2887296 RepID=UPI001E5EA284|nr:molybdate ABC transporter substrate-binding protein [Bacillus sp. REN16]MCC3356275.1 molybdate ABC transporter substrate-binding protein [Bacillus sp. REN16]